MKSKLDIEDTAWTPGPWENTGKSTFHGGYFQISSRMPEQSHWIAHVQFEPDAARIVQCVNAHDELVAALKPLAAIALQYEELDRQRLKHFADEGRAPGPGYADSHRVSVSLGELRAALKALSP